MRSWSLAQLFIGVVVTSALAVAAEVPRSLDLRTAIDTAMRDSPSLRAATARIEEAKGDLVGASVLLVDNPEASVAAGPRRAGSPGDEDTTDVEFGLEQRFETGGQRGRRIERARAEVRGREAGAEDAHRVVSLAVATAFFEALGAERRAKIREDDERLAMTLSDVARLRLERGEGTPLEENTARIRLAEARRSLSVGRGESRAKTIRLLELLALASGEISLEGDLPEQPLREPEPELVAKALESRADLRALRSEIEAAQAGVRLADAEAWPGISIGGSLARDGDDDVALGVLRLPLPIFYRNQGERIRARATVDRLEAQYDARRIAVEAGVRSGYAAYEQALRSLHLYDTGVLRAQEESLELLRRAFAAGEVGYADVVALEREVIQGREGYLDARLDYARFRARLLAAANLPQAEGVGGTIP